MEGNCAGNDWWAWEEAGRVPRSGEACDHYHRYEADLDIARSLGHNAYRFSLEWSRIEPRPGQISEEGLEHYAQVIQACHDRGLEPIVTLHHFTVPVWFADQGGWSASGSVERFSRFVKTVAERLGGKVHWWITVNEPTVLVYYGYLQGIWPPGKRSVGKGNRAIRNLIQAHHRAYGILHHVAELNQQAAPRVGIAHHIRCYDPCQPNSRWDRWMARFIDGIMNRWVLSACSKSMDFIGLNYYTRDFIRWLGPPSWMEICSGPHHAEVRSRNSLGWEIYPEGLKRILLNLKRYELPILIAENGICTEDDHERDRFIRDHLEQMEEAIAQGVQVQGYLYWSLIDNFEWAHGFAPRFGLVEVMESSLERRIRPSALKFSDWIRSHSSHPASP